MRKEGETLGGRLEVSTGRVGALRRKRRRVKTYGGKGCVVSMTQREKHVTSIGLAGRTARKARGLLFARPGNVALLLMPCNDVHTVGMRHRLDIAFVDASGLVLEVHRDVGPFRRIRKRGAVAVVERFSSCASPWFTKGDQVGMVRLEGGVS